MKTYFDRTRGRLIVMLVVLLGALCLVATQAISEDTWEGNLGSRSGRGGVNTTYPYTGASSATTPIVSIQSSSMPMVSGGAVRAYAHYGHAARQSASSGSGFRLHTTSSATIHTIGSGGGGRVGSAGGSSSSSRGVNYGGGSVAMPSFAIAVPAVASNSQAEESPLMAAAPSRRGHVRKANSHAGETGSAGDKYPDTENPSIWWYWDEGEEDWVSGDPPVGTVKEEGGVMYEWDGFGWIPKGQVADLGTPIGDAPWWLMAMMLMLYGTVRTMKRRTLSKK